MPSSEVMSKWKAGSLHSGSKKGSVVKNQKQAIAIMLSEKRAEGQHGGKYPEKRKGYQFGGSPMIPPNIQAMLPPQAQANMAMPHPMSGPPPQSGTPFGTPLGAAINPMQGFGAQQGPGLGAALGMAQQQRALAGAPGLPPQVAGMGQGYAYGGSPTSMGLTPGWIERQEARNISHTGPIISAVGGRTDHHSINVPSGSYVLPAAHVSAMGQGNTLNGMKILQGMFGPPMKMPHGAGPPRMHAPPSLMPKTPGLGMSSSGGSRGDDNTGRPVPIMAAGGEFVLSPDQVARVGKGNLDHGHAILDHWVKKTHKKYAKTVANLPPPAKT